MTESVLLGTPARGLWFMPPAGDHMDVRLVGLGLDVTTSVYAVDSDGVDGLVDFVTQA